MNNQHNHVFQNCILTDQLLSALLFCVDTLDQVNLISVNLRIILWLKAWSAEAACKRCPTCMPFEVERLHQTCHMNKGPFLTKEDSKGILLGASTSSKQSTSIFGLQPLSKNSALYLTQELEYKIPQAFLSVKDALTPRSGYRGASVTVCPSLGHRCPRAVGLIGVFK